MSGVRISHHPPSPLYVLRHGETEWNVARRMQGGEGDSPLTERGQRQAAEMGALIAAAGAGDLPVFTGPQGRARETARIAFGAGRAVPDARLSEIGMGPFSGRVLWELQAEHPDVFRDGSLDWYFRVPGGETFDAMRARIQSFLDERDGPAVVVCHGMTARVLRGSVLGLDRAATLALPGGQGMVWRITNGVHEVLGA